MAVLENYYDSVEIMVKDLESRQMSMSKYKNYIEETERLILEKRGNFRKRNMVLK